MNQPAAGNLGDLKEESLLRGLSAGFQIGPLIGPLRPDGSADQQGGRFRATRRVSG